MHPKIESSKLEILYDGYDYDVTELSKRHPVKIHPDKSEKPTGPGNRKEANKQTTFGVLDGVAGGWCRRHHNRHHAIPQRVDHNLDLNPMTVIANATNTTNKLCAPKQALLRKRGHDEGTSPTSQQYDSDETLSKTIKFGICCLSDNEMRNDIKSDILNFHVPKKHSFKNLTKKIL
ncbi:hypothetical protein Fcan01_25188 [Folsomia candida]|uniref:Uncharacterized protein n=1 Tax=Folsomia candida TaxID=158441 RepID=A0A226D5Q4_FOLCA|nr:hypothetical protein Fcan01_25188 [Folsomia candida]